MPNFFVSYRRSDTDGRYLAHMLFRDLRSRYGEESVFLDVDSRNPGLSFPKKLEMALDRSHAVLVVIGKDWLNRIVEKQEDERDWVRFEVAESLKREGLPVVPVCHVGTNLPNASQLPEELKELATRDGVSLDPFQDFDSHLNRLLLDLERVIASRTSTQVKPKLRDDSLPVERGDIRQQPSEDSDPTHSQHAPTQSAANLRRMPSLQRAKERSESVHEVRPLRTPNTVAGPASTGSFKDRLSHASMAIKLVTSIVLGVTSAAAFNSLHTPFLKDLGFIAALVPAIPFGVAVFALIDGFAPVATLRTNLIVRLLLFSFASPLGYWSAIMLGSSLAGENEAGHAVGGAFGATVMLLAMLSLVRGLLERPERLIAVVVAGAVAGYFFKAIRPEVLSYTVWQASVLLFIAFAIPDLNRDYSKLTSSRNDA